jgi:hypothetical protein
LRYWLPERATVLPQRSSDTTTQSKISLTTRGDVSNPMIRAIGALAPWPWGEGEWEVPRWAFALIFFMIIAPTAWLLLRRLLNRKDS